MEKSACYFVCEDVSVISFDDWEIVDAVEKERGELLGKPREKFVSIEEMFAAVKKKRQMC